MKFEDFIWMLLCVMFVNLASISLSEHGRFRFDVALKLKLNPGKSLLTQLIVL